MFEEKIKMINGEFYTDESINCEKRIYTVYEIQDILGISKTTAYNLIRSGEFRCVRVGGHYRISKKSFDEWLDKQIDSCQVCKTHHIN